MCCMTRHSKHFIKGYWAKVNNNYNNNNLNNSKMVHQSLNHINHCCARTLIIQAKEEYIDKCFYRTVMGKPNKTLMVSSKRNRPKDLPRATSSGGISSDILLSIDQRLSQDVRLNLVEALHKELLQTIKLEYCQT